MEPLESFSQYLKIDEAARMLGVSRRWVYRRIWSGELPASKVGGLYFIQRSELEALLDQRQPARQTISTPEPEPEKCGYCFRLINRDDPGVKVCQAAGCNQLICSRCQAEGIHYCAAHMPDRKEKLEQIEQSYQRGEIPLLVKASSARFLEMNFLNRLQARIERITNLIHPVSNELLTIEDWAELRSMGDERTQVMRLLNKVMLDNETLARTPLNTYLTYSIPTPRRSKGSPLHFHVQVISRLSVMLRDGFDTTPLDDEDLQPLLARFSETCKQEQDFRILVLASPTGWSQAACQVIQGQSVGTAFVHRQMLVYLYDLVQGKLIYSPYDERLGAYAELFTPLQPAEQLEEAQRAIQSELVLHNSLSLEYATQVLPYPSAVLRQAFDKLVSSGRYSLLELPEYGLVIARK